MDILLLFGAGAAQRITYDFLKLLILLPIAIVIDLIIKAVRNKNEKGNKSKTVAKKKTNSEYQKEVNKSRKGIHRKKVTKELRRLCGLSFGCMRHQLYV